MKNNSITFLSLFSGGGGLDIGFKEAGFDCICANDIESYAGATFETNFPNIPFIHKDITKISSNEILELTNGIYPDVIIGGPPCQGYSVMGDKSTSDVRNLLFKSYARLVNDLNPKAFLFENVKGIKTMFNGRFLNEVMNSFSALGYDVHYEVINSADFGVPQNRLRVFIFATRLNYNWEFPIGDDNNFKDLKSFENVNEAIIKDYDSTKLANHTVLNHKGRVIARYKLIKEGGKLPPPEELPKEIRRKNFGNTYVRLDRNKKAVTMVPGNNAFPIHPLENRSLTQREAARIQTFPDNFIFKGTRREQCILVGNAVPPLLAAKLAEQIKKHLNNQLKNNQTPDLIKGNQIKIQNGNKAKKLNFVDLFCGAGGITRGFINAGLEPLIVADIMDASQKTHEANYPNIPFESGDLRLDKVKKNIKKHVKDLDILVGGPPCQGFSMYGKRRFINTKKYKPEKDDRNDLVTTFLDYAELLNPKWIMMENVPGLPSLNNGDYLKMLLNRINLLGYKNFSWKIINCASYGAPQKRKRFILIATKQDYIIPWPKHKFFDKPEDWQKPFRVINEVLTGIEGDRSIKNHKPMNHSEMTVERFKTIKEGKKLEIDKLPEKLKYSRSGRLIRNYSNIFKRLDRNEPSCTLVPGHSAFPIHPWENRQLTIREAARIQTFPDDVEFFGSQSDQCTQVGNAFPVLVAEQFANNITKCVKNNWTKSNTSNLAHYSYVESD